VEGSEGGELVSLSLAPTFDHASSMGRNEPLDRMEARLTTKDEGFTVESYAARARSALYSQPDDLHPLSPRAAYLVAARIAPEAGAAWCDRLRYLGDEVVRDIVGQVPDVRMTDVARRFVVRMFCYNRRRIEEGCQSP
jgi:hypothetical protein